MKIKIALIFGGRSTEHDISVISALQAKNSLDKEKYDVFPIYLTRNNEMYYGERTGEIGAYRDIDKLISESERVALVRDGDRVRLIRIEKKLFSKSEIAEIDLAFPVVHGTNTEDGTIQGYCQTLGIAYVGCDLTSSAVGMDKYLTKIVLKNANIPVLDCIKASSADYKEDSDALLDRIEGEIGYPVIVKPINCGSSIGISRADDRDALVESLDDAFNYADHIIAERAITSLREINCSVLGDSRKAEASECEEPVSTDTILSFEDKYQGGAKGAKTGGAKSEQSAGMSSLKRKIPAPIPAEMREYIRDMAVKSFKALGCSGVSRIDFLMDGESGEIFFNEINTIPGSLSFYLWEPLGVKYTELLDRMIAIALREHRRRNALTYAFESSVLSNIQLSGAKGSKR